MAEERQNIYKISRTIKRRESTLYNALRSIYEDSAFVGEISQLWPELPLVANLRCGLWYSPKFDFNCYFKSTDGHTNNLSFNISRLNLHVALLAGTAFYFIFAFLFGFCNCIHLLFLCWCDLYTLFDCIASPCNSSWLDFGAEIRLFDDLCL